MIQTEIKGDLIRTWSDRGVKIHGGYPEGDYDEAIDPVAMGRTYVETDIPVDPEDIPVDPDNPTVEEKAEAYDILMGEENDDQEQS